MKREGRRTKDEDNTRAIALEVVPKMRVALPTLKALNSKAQGCRVSGYPGKSTQ
jgi:hypothetical protein